MREEVEVRVGGRAMSLLQIQHWIPGSAKSLANYLGADEKPRNSRRRIADMISCQPCASQSETLPLIISTRIAAAAVSLLLPDSRLLSLERFERMAVPSACSGHATIPTW